MPSWTRIFTLVLAAACTVFPGNNAAADANTPRLANATARKTAFSRPDAVAPPSDAPALSQPLVLSAPPREPAAEGMAIYQPLAEYLSKAVGRRVVYRHPGTWGAYRSDMLRGNYDLIFDGPHFNSYRAERLNHNILVRVPDVQEFVVITRTEHGFRNLSELAGHSICSHAPPNLGTLVVTAQFENPARQPIIANTSGWDSIFAAVQGNRCRAGIIPMANLKKLDPHGVMQVLFKSRPMLNQAFSAGPRVTTVEQTRITTALLSPEAAGPTERLRNTYRVGPAFAAATNKQYEGLSQYLRNEWGYY